MDLYLVRHAEAEPERPDGGDAARALSAAGAERFRAGVAGLARLGVRLDRIEHSPLLRAQETAELLLPLLDDGGETAVAPELARASAGALLARIGDAGGERVALVGHEPSLSALIATLVLGWELVGEPQGEPFALDKGGVAWLAGDPRAGSMTLRALWPAKTLRKIGR